jgi:hypothetical protein
VNIRPSTSVLHGDGKLRYISRRYEITDGIFLILKITLKLQEL